MNALTKMLILSGVLQIGATAHARDALLVIPNKDERLVVVQAERGALQPVLELGMTASYGESDRQIAFVTNRPLQTGRWTIDVLDKSTLKVTASWPISGDVNMQLSGPTPDVVLTSDYAYFITVQVVSVGANRLGLGSNAQGGAFELARLSLSTGAQKSWPLPADCVNARLVNFDGVPLVYAWDGRGVWKFDASTQALEQLVTGDRFPEVRETEKNMREFGIMPAGAFADFVVLPRAGIMRLSRFGTLQPELGADLRQVPTDTSARKPGLRGRIVRIFAGTYDKSPAIGLVRKLSGRTLFAYVDAGTTSPLWETPVPETASTGSLFPTTDNALIYVDTARGEVNRLAPDGSTTLWKLDPKLPRLGDARILSLGGGTNPGVALQ